MDQHLSFERLIQYDPGQPGITLDISLRLSASIVNFPAKVDTGASYCISVNRFDALQNVKPVHRRLTMIALGYE
jgi:hypothetical protein